MTVRLQQPHLLTLRWAFHLAASWRSNSSMYTQARLSSARSTKIESASVMAPTFGSCWLDTFSDCTHRAIANRRYVQQHSHQVLAVSCTKGALQRLQFAERESFISLASLQLFADSFLNHRGYLSGMTRLVIVPCVSAGISNTPLTL